MSTSSNGQDENSGHDSSQHLMPSMTRAPHRKRKFEMSTPTNNRGHRPDGNSLCDQGQPLPPDTYDPDEPDLNPEQTEHMYRFFAAESGLNLPPLLNTAQNPNSATPQAPIRSLCRPPRPQIPPFPQGQDRKRPGEAPHAPAGKEANKRIKRPNPDLQPSNVQRLSHQGGYYQGHVPQTRPSGGTPDATSTFKDSAYGQVGGLNLNNSLFGQVQTGGTQCRGRGPINRQHVANDGSFRDDSEPSSSDYPDPETSAPHYGHSMSGYGGAQSVIRQPFLTKNSSSLSSNSRLHYQGSIHSAVFTSAHSSVSPQRHHQSSQVYGDNDDSHENSALTLSGVDAGPNPATLRSSQLSIYRLKNDPRNEIDLQLLEGNPSQFIQTREELLTDLEYLHRLAVRLQPSTRFYATLRLNHPAWNEVVRIKYVKRLGKAVAKYGDIPGFRFRIQKQEISKNAKAVIQNSSPANAHGQFLIPPLPTLAHHPTDLFPVTSPVSPNHRGGPHISRVQGITEFHPSLQFSLDPRLYGAPHAPIDPQLLISPQRTSATPNPGTQLAVESQNVPNTQAPSNSFGIQSGFSSHNNGSSTSDSSSA